MLRCYVGRFEDRSSALGNYQIAISPSPEGPFSTVPGGSGPMPGAGRIGDYNIFVDDDGRYFCFGNMQFRLPDLAMQITYLLIWHVVHVLGFLHSPRAYHVRTGFDIVLLNESFTGPAEHIANFSTPKPSEGPTMFKRNGTCVRYFG